MSNTHTSTKAIKRLCQVCSVTVDNVWPYRPDYLSIANNILHLWLASPLLRWLRLQYTHARSNNQEIHEHEHLTIKTKILTPTMPSYRVFTENAIVHSIWRKVKKQIRNFVNKTFIVGCYLYWCKVDNTMSWVIAELIILLHCCVKINIFQFLV